MLGIETAFVAVVSNKPEFNIAYGHPSALQQGFMTACFPIFACIGSILGLFLASMARLRWILVVCTIVWAAGYIMTCILLSFHMFLLGRMIKCTALGIVSSIIPLYIQEVFPAQRAQYVLASVQSTIPFGVFFTSLMFTSFEKSITFNHCWFVTACPVASILITCFLGKSAPCSPRPDDESEDALQTTSNKHKDPNSSEKTATSSNRRRKSTRHSGIEWEFVDLQLQPDGSSTNGNKLAVFSPVLMLFKNVRLLFSPLHRRRFGLAVATQILVQLTGVNIIMYYMPFICQIAGLSPHQTSFTSLGIYGFNFVTTLCSLSIINKFGRTMLMRIGCLLLSLIHLAIFILMLTGKPVPPIDGNPSATWSLNAGPGICVLVCCFLFILAFGFLVSGASMVYTSEIVPLEVQNAGVAIAIAVGWLANFCVAVCGPAMLSTIKYATFGLFSVICCFLFALVLFFDETRTKKYEHLYNRERETQQHHRLFQKHGAIGLI